MEDPHTLTFEEVLHTELDAVAHRRNDPFHPKKEKENAYRRAERFGLFGLCFSGGGIRSATFNLGVLQALQRLNLLGRVDYLSTVSGGGYIGSWFLSWIKRLSAFPNLHGDVIDGEFREPNPIRHLRRFSNYLTPRVGVMSADTWSIASTYIRNLLLNAFIIVPLLASALFLPRLILASSTFHVIDPRSLIVAGYVLLVIACYCVGLNLVWERDGASSAGESVRGRSPKKEQAQQKRTKVPVSFVLAVAFTFLASFLAAYVMSDPDVRQEFISGEETQSRWMVYGLLWYAGLWAFAWILSFILPFGKTRKLGANSSPVMTVAGGDARPNWQTIVRGFRAWGSVLAGGLAAGPVCGFLFFHIYRSLLSRLGPDDILVFGMPIVVGGLSLAMMLQVGFAGSRLPDHAREWWSRFGAWMIIGTTVWVIGTGVAIFAENIIGILTGWLSGFQITLSWIVTTAAGLFFAKGRGTGKEDSSPLLEFFVKITPVVFVAGFVILVSYWIHVWCGSLLADPAFVSTAIACCLATSAFFAWRVNVNTFSMNSMYYNRLVRCYLGASRENRSVNPVIGFDEKDDEYRMHEFRNYAGPYPIINTAVNLVKGKELSWQKRKASSFFFTPDHCGFRSGILDRYGDAAEFPVTLGRVVSISGAAASPNMGYHTSAPLAFLMTIFNIRLGSWFPNPGIVRKGRGGYVNTERGPGWGLLYLLRELFGLADERSSYLYLSDGGHFENLGLYELVRRRCRHIIVCDAGADPTMTFSDLGNAIEKCRADFGVEIDLKTDALSPTGATGQSTAHWALGSIRYPRALEEQRRTGEGEFEGEILYIKSTVTGDEPADVLSYRQTHEGFPHESTADQWFDESQFESYRKLGYHIGGTLSDGPVKSVASLFNSLRRPKPQRGVQVKAKRATDTRSIVPSS